jgi:hypothetical protein
MSLAESEGPCLTNNKNRDNEVAPKTGSLIIIMQEPAEETEASIPTENVRAEASIPTENVEEDPNLNVTFPVRRKAAKRTLPWDLKAGELNLMPSLSSPQAEDIPATKKPRLEKPFSATADDATTKHSSHDTEVSLPDATAADNTDADADPVKRTRTSWTWTLEEDAKLKDAVMNTRKKMYNKEYRTNWVAVAALVPNRTKIQCNSRWEHVLVANIDQASGYTGEWSEDEDIKLKDAVQTHGGKNWGAIAVLVRGRTKSQCRQRWRNVLDPSIDRVTGKWTEDEDNKLKDAVQTHGGKNWGAIAALVPGRTGSQCAGRWNHTEVNRVNGRTGKWTEEEDRKLKDAVQTHGGKNWVVIGALVPGRTNGQCRQRWHDGLHPSIDRVNGRTGIWTEDEDIKLEDAVQTHGGKNWAAIAAMVPGRTKSQCTSRWPHTKVNRATRPHTGK